MREIQRPDIDLQGPLIVLRLCVKTFGNPAKDERDAETRYCDLQGLLIVLLLCVNYW